MDMSNQVKIYLEPELLQMTDTYRAELRGQGITTSRSALFAAAMLEYLQARREEAARKEDRKFQARVAAAALPKAQTIEQRRGLVEMAKEEEHA